MAVTTISLTFPRQNVKNCKQVNVKPPEQSQVGTTDDKMKNYAIMTSLSYFNLPFVVFSIGNTNSSKRFVRSETKQRKDLGLWLYLQLYHTC